MGVRQNQGPFPLAGPGLGRCGYNAHQVNDTMAQVPVLRMEIVKRTDDMNGFVVLPRRWVVERTFSGFGRCRRLAKDMGESHPERRDMAPSRQHPPRHPPPRKSLISLTEFPIGL